MKLQSKIIGIVLLACCFCQNVHAQIGEHRDDFSVGFNGGYVMSSVGFVPKVNQKQHGGMTFGLSLRYKSEKYFSTLCSIAAEVNYAQLGWKEDIVDAQERPVVNATTGLTEQYSRTVNYIQRNTHDRVNPVVAQDTMQVEKKFDYGIAIGLGGEYSHPKVGHFLLEARYYYGLGNIYGSSKRDFFSKSNYGNIVIKATYLFDILRTKKPK